MYEKTDALIAGLIIIGTLYGAFKGPFALLLPVAGITAGHSLISWLRPQLLSLFSDEGNRAIVSLVYYPLCYFMLLGLLSYAGRRIDRRISRLLPFGRYLLGGLLGFFLSTFSILAVLTFSLPLIKNHAPDDYRKSTALCMADNFLQKNPAVQKKIHEILRYDKIEKQISAIKTKQGIPEKNTEKSPFMTKPGAEDKLENHAEELAGILQQLEGIAADYQTVANELESENNLNKNGSKSAEKNTLNTQTPELKKLDLEKLRYYQTELMEELQKYESSEP
jgi:hypothetical protein